jgi:hypothetical protein
LQKIPLTKGYTLNSQKPLKPAGIPVIFTTTGPLARYLLLHCIIPVIEMSAGIQRACITQYIVCLCWAVLHYNVAYLCDIIGEIIVKGGLYQVFMSGSKAGAHAADANEVLSINDLHRLMGHVSHERARLLVKKGLVEGVTLENNSEVIVCESCGWAKGQRK